jgi:hypothetical protein
MTTPSLQAKQFAADNGFVIVTNNGKYDVTHTATGTKFTRSSYPAVLNEMREIDSQYVVARSEEAERAADDDIFLSVDKVVNHPAFKDMPNARAVLQQQIESETLMPPRKMTTEELDALGKILPMTREQAREVAHRMGRGPRKPVLVFNVDKSRGGKWYVLFNGNPVTFNGFRTRADALKLVRQGMNGEMRHNWRKARVTIEFAWSI